MSICFHPLLLASLNIIKNCQMTWIVWFFLRFSVAQKSTDWYSKMKKTMWATHKRESSCSEWEWMKIIFDIKLPLSNTVICNRSFSLCLSLSRFLSANFIGKKFDCSTLLSLFSVVHKNSCEQVVPFHLRVSSFFHRHHQNRQKLYGRKITALIKNRRTRIHSNIKPMKIYVTLGNEWLKIMKKK